MADTSADDTQQPAAPDVDPAAPNPADSGTTPSAKVSDQDKINQQLADAKASNEALQKKNEELINEKKGEKKKKQDALAEQGRFEELAKSRLETIEEQQKQIENLTSASQQMQSTQTALDATLAEVKGYVTDEMSGLSEDQIALLNANIAAYSGTTLAEMPATQQLKAVRTFKAGLAKQPNGLGAGGTGQPAMQKEQQMQQAEKSGNLNALLGSMFPS